MEAELEPRVKPLPFKVKEMSRESSSQKAAQVLEPDLRSHWSTGTNTKEWILLELLVLSSLSSVESYFELLAKKVDEDTIVSKNVFCNTLFATQRGLGDERPFEESIDKNESDAVGIAVDQSREYVGRHRRERRCFRR